MPNDRAVNRRQFTQAARDAALAKRRAQAALPKDPLGQPELFVVRAPVGTDFGWQIRRFGAIVMAESDGAFADAESAWDAGRQALRSMPR